MLLKKFLSSVLLLGIILLTGCSYTIERTYTPQLGPLENTKNYSINTKVNYIPVFPDDPKAVGVLKHPFGCVVQTLYMNEDVEKNILDSFQQELIKAGYLVNDKNAKNQVEVVLNVNQFFVEPWMGMWSVTAYGILSIETKVVIPGNSSCYTMNIVSYNELSSGVYTRPMIIDRLILVEQEELSRIVREINSLLISKT
jgi:hypothetical protein